MSKYQPYPEYKDSGIEWLGNIPKHWIATKVKYKAPYQVGWTPPTKNDENFIGENIWVTIGDLNERIVTHTKSCISDEAAKKASMDITPKGSLLYSFKLSVGTVAFAGEDLYTNEAIASFLENKYTDINYLYYATPLFILQNASENIYGAKILNQELISNATLAIPDINEQTTIANFLNRETTKIDTLIEKQQELIELLKEKRQAVISHAVTKGLDPNVKMKDSGVEWLGEVPEEWVISALKRVGSIRYGIGEPPKYHVKGSPLIRATNVKSGYIVEKGLVFVNPEDIPAQRIVWLKTGDIIVVRSGALTGDSAIITDKYHGSIAGFDMVYRSHKVFSMFVQYALLSSYLKNGQIDLEKMRAAQPHLNAEELGSCLFIMPPKNEQHQIVEYLNTQTKKIDTLIKKANQAISLLKERRIALISAAVTGKIDVRGEK